MSKVRPGIEVLLSKYLKLLIGKRIGLITNPTGVDSNLVSTADLLFNHPKIKLTKLFGPEHGIRGDIFAGDHIGNEIDTKTGLSIYSLYGATRKPTPEMLKDIDILIFDIQDVGARYYTYVYTMAYAMEAAKESGIKFIVLDRPNPINGLLIDGPILDPKFSSFIGLYPIPIVHGLTIGELAQLFNNKFKIHCDLKVIPMTGWKRNMSFSDTGLPWILTSPQIPQSATCWHYVITGFIGELGSLSTGVGYTLPFEIVGAPWIDSTRLSDSLNKTNLPGVIFRPLIFRPYYFQFKDQPCGGIQIHITDYKKLKPVEIGFHILYTIYKLYPDAGIFNVSNNRLKMFYQATGSDIYSQKFQSGKSISHIIRGWKANLNKFNYLRNEYLLY